MHIKKDNMQATLAEVDGSRNLMKTENKSR